jgi:tetratricopeptide (TPR) repeat protein
MRHLLKSVFALSVVSFALLPAPSFADDATDAGKLLRAGQLPEAMQKVDAVLAQRPKDAQMRFLKGLILAEQNKNPEAITIFTKLTDDFPELPEPYNNLAVLYASSGQYDKARTALEMAIRTNPTYGTAHENLGDIYAKLASQAYDKALQLDSANSGAKLKLTLVKSLIGNTTGGSNPKTAMPPTQVTAQAANQSPASKLAATPTVTTKTEPSAAKVAAVKVEPPTTKVDAKPATKAAVAVNTDQSDILNATENWAKAWSSKDTNAYLAHYAKDFQTPKNESRKAWAEERRARIEGKGRINVKIETPKVTIDGHTASVKFRQIYSSDQLTANSRKSLELVKQDGKWLIKAERTGN